MKLRKSFQLALNTLLHSKLRSWLTILGIVIGIAAVVSIVSISEGAKASLEERLGDLGADVITISPGYSKAQGAGGSFRGMKPPEDKDVSSSEQNNLTSKDVMVLKGISNVQLVMGEVSNREEVTYSSKSSTVSIKGVDTVVWKDITNEDLAFGRFLSQGDSFSVVLGGDIVDKTFEGDIPLNGKIDIAGKSFKVVGILEGGSTAYISIDVARDVLEDVGEKDFDSISVKIEDVDISEQTEVEIVKKLMFARSILSEADRDFTVSSPRAMQETMQETMDTMSLFLGAIAAISLLVGAIGIANTMFTSVLEKTREIGIMKAIGTKNRDVMIIFLLNSGMIGLVGGIGGIGLGVLGSSAISMMGSSSGGGMTSKIFSSTLVSPDLLLFALGFSIIIGMVAGAIPAYRASKLKPVDALRYQ
jgi:putative ABC transport system permease protein